MIVLVAQSTIINSSSSKIMGNNDALAKHPANRRAFQHSTCEKAQSADRSECA